MNILIPDSWLREYLETSATPRQIKDCLSLCGPSVERVNGVGKDFIYNIEITSNRIDMASVYGIAREAAAILPRFGIPAKIKQINIHSPSEVAKKLPLEVIDTDHLCNRLLAIVLENVNIAQSPDYIQERLEKSGIRALNNLIDITNYIMLELGHPCHVFDYDRIKTGKLILRKAQKEEFLVTLDNKKCKLTPDDVIIDDGTGRIIDLPGIMGTANSVVTQQTKRIVFFIESNNPVNIRRTSMRLALRTMAATINEKHPDPELARTALLYGIQLYQKLAKAKIASRIIDIYPNPAKPKAIKTTVKFINERLGIKLKKQEIIDILRSLSFQVEEIEITKNTSLKIVPPSFRQFDVTIPEDIVEEVARIYGYHNLPSRLMSSEIPITDKPKDLPIEEKIKQILKYWGYTEVYHYSFISPNLIEKVGSDKNYPLKIVNPLTEETVYMRASLVPSILETVAKNQSYKEKLSLFELAKVYIPRKNNLPEEISMLSIVNQNSFYELKGVVECLLEELGISDYFLLERQHPYWHPQQSVNFAKNDSILLTLGKIHPKLASVFNLKHDLFIAEINVTRLVDFINPKKSYIPISTYPASIEDLALQHPPKTKIGPIISEIKKISNLVKRVDILDRYQNTTTFRITYQDNKRNLAGSDVQKIRQKILQNLGSKFQAILKK